MIKGTEAEAKEIKNPYPMLMIGQSGAIYFITERVRKDLTGFVIKEGTSGYGLGFYSETWKTNMLEPYTGKLTLQNEEV